MTKDVVKQLIAESQEFATSIPFHRRSYSFEENLNYVLVGLRRAGKSFLLFQIIHDLLAAGHSKEEILYFNFEDDRLGTLSIESLDLIKTCYEEMYNVKPIFFLDEIQIVKGWEIFVRRLADRQFRVYVTGSNAQMLSSEIATTLGGRFMIKEVFPYSFAEFLSIHDIDVEQPNVLYAKQKEIIKQFEKFFMDGGLPEVQQVVDKRSWLSNLFDKIFFGDLISRNAIRNDFTIRLLIKKLAENIKQPSSYNRLANIVLSAGKKISVSTVIDYLQYMKDSWLLLPYENICAKMADKESNKKYYFIDNGLLNLFLMDYKSSSLENLAAVHLRKKYGTNVYYYQKQIEVDFYAPDVKMAIQVSYSLQDAETKTREVETLLKLSKFLEVEQMLIITKDEEDIIQAGEKQIRVVPIWKWLLETK